MVKTGKKCFISAKSLKPPKYYIQPCTVLSTNLPTIMSDVLHTIPTFDKILAEKVCTKHKTLQLKTLLRFITILHKY